MRVLMVSDFYPPIIGGIQHHVRELAMSLSMRGHEVHIITSDSPDSGIESDGIVRVIRTRHMLSYLKFLYLDKEARQKFVPPMPDIFLSRRIEKAVKEFKPDVIHAHGWSIYTVGALKRRYRDLPMIATSHDARHFCPIQGCFNPRTRGFCNQRRTTLKCLSCAREGYGPLKAVAVTASLSVFRGILNRFDKILAVSNYQAKIARESGFRNIVVVPNFINFDALDPKPSNEGTLSSDVLCVMRGIEDMKGIDVTLKAYDIVQGRLKQADLTLVGKVEPGYPVPSKVLKNPSVEVVLNASHDLVMECIRNTKVLVVPSIVPESFCLVALEGMALKKPVVASSVGGLQELVRNHKTGLLVPPGDHMLLAKAICSLLEDGELATRMGVEGFKVAFNEYSAAKVVPIIERIYEQPQAGEQAWN